MYSKRKMLEFHIEFDDLAEAKRQILEVLGKMENSVTNYGREMKNGCLLQWGVSYADFINHRIEMIDDKKCIVIPSKLRCNE